MSLLPLRALNLPRLVLFCLCLTPCRAIHVPPPQALHPHSCINHHPHSLFTPPSSPAPTDDESPPHLLSQTPWSFPSYCLPSTSSLGESDISKLCVYTSTAFNQNTGISIIAHPETAATLVSAIFNSTASYSARHHIAGRNSLKDNPYVVTSISGKGMGVIATRHIEQFSTIMVSFPALVIDNELFPDEEEEEVPGEGPRLFARALGQLSDQERVLSLARSRGTDDEEEHRGGGKIHVVEDIVRTNAFGIYTVDGRDFKGLYPEIARLNHGCDPNAYGRYTKGDLAMTAVATRNIEPGEEITISYIPLGMPTSYRHQGLANWSFKCTCPLCSSPPSALSASDARGNRLPELLYLMKQLAPTSSESLEQTQANYETLVQYTQEFVSILQVERLFPKVAEFYQQFMKMYYGFGDIESAYKYAQTALKFGEIFSDPEGGFCGGLRMDLEFLEGLMAEQGVEEPEGNE
ncbi:hypothetical protein V8F20_005384 [Naviculisporaceae sp. PSN 640]